MNYVLDVHTHTLASGHAYSTIAEMAQAAAGLGLEALGITEHGPTIPGSCAPLYFSNFKVIDRHNFGVELLMGVELNIVSYDGAVDLEPNFLRWIDVGIAGIHPGIGYTPGSVAENTRAYLGAMQNPAVDIISHPEDARVPVDYQQLVLAAKETGVLLELNNTSLDPFNIRGKGNCAENMRTLLSLCERYGVEVVVGSDAHYITQVARFGGVISILESCHFPEELVVNTSVAKLKRHLHRFNKGAK